jgi:acyl-CoA reductase-like NAD-dependent aldehyde dehydrogenase
VNQLHAGTVYVNCYDYSEGVTPFGGFKDSGIGKDLGEEGLESYLLTKTVIIRHNQL